MFTITNSIQSYINAMVEDIKADAPNSSGSLRSSIKSTVNVNEDGFTIGVDMLDYGLYQDQGVNGTKKSWGAPYSFQSMPPPSKLDKWVVSKGIAPRSGGKFTSRKGINFVIARSIMENGIRPKNFIEPNLDNKLEGLANLTAEEIWNEFYKNNNK